MSIHHTSIIDKSSKIGAGSTVMEYTVIRKNVIIGNECYIDSHCVFTGHSIIGNNVTIRNGCIIARGVEIGDNTFIAPQVMFQNLDSDKIRIGGAKIGKNCFIGTNVTFKEGVTVCDNVKIGSKSYVNKDITKPGLYIGSPIRRVTRVKAWEKKD